MARDKTDKTDKTPAATTSITATQARTKGVGNRRLTKEYSGTDITTLEVVAFGAGGDFECLARHIENGGLICDGMRRLLADVLRGVVKRPRNRPLTLDQRNLERAFLRRIWFQQVSAAIDGRSLSDYAALNILLEHGLSINEDTARNYLKKARARAKGKKVRTS